MFDSLSDRLNTIFKKLKGHGKLTEKNVEEGLREVRIALLEADVHYKVTKKLVADIKERALGQEVMASLTPGQQVIKIVNDELTELMGGRFADLNLSGVAPTSVMLVGLQGSGKTTTAGKLAVFLRKRGRKPYLVPADVYRPAAIDQLIKLGEQLTVSVFPSSVEMDPVQICQEARTTAHREGYDTLLLDTAGRLHVDEELMAELCRIKDTVKPSDILLVADAMTGQDAVNIAESFNNTLDIGGVVLTKMDGDARGGAAISIKSITDKPIKFIGVGEKLSDLEPFHPDRMSSRILGMGDVQAVLDLAKRLESEGDDVRLKRISSGKMNMDDFYYQLEEVTKVGSLRGFLDNLPGFSGQVKEDQLDQMENRVSKWRYIIQSMTKQEKADPDLQNSSRIKRIARGSGWPEHEVKELLKNYKNSKSMMKASKGRQMQGTLRRMGLG